MMNVSRSLMVAAWPLICCWGLVQAQEPAPKGDARTARGASVAAPKTEVRVPEGPFLVKPYLQPGIAWRRARWS